jgi:hypothetical protein
MKKRANHRDFRQSAKINLDLRTLKSILPPRAHVVVSGAEEKKERTKSMTDRTFQPEIAQAHCTQALMPWMYAAARIVRVSGNALSGSDSRPPG